MKRLQSTVSTVMVMKSNWVFIVLVQHMNMFLDYSFFWLQGDHSGKIGLRKIIKELPNSIVAEMNVVRTRWLFVTPSNMAVRIWYR